jgi:signal transduction histidine kinase
LRHNVGFDLVQMTSEFRHLRACVIRLWVDSLVSPDMAYFQDMIRFNEAIDEALAESTAAYAEQVNRSRDIFLAILGHDLRAPLQAVSMSTELLLRKTALEGDALACVTHIQRGTRHMTVMVSDLLELVRSRLGRSLPIEPAPWTWPKRRMRRLPRPVRAIRSLIRPWKYWATFVVTGIRGASLSCCRI